MSKAEPAIVVQLVFISSQFARLAIVIYEAPPKIFAIKHLHLAFVKITFTDPLVTSAKMAHLICKLTIRKDAQNAFVLARRPDVSLRTCSLKM